MSLQIFDKTQISPEESTPAADRLISGNPVQTTWLAEASADGKRFAGFWQSTPGAWRVVYEEWEFCHIISGHSRLIGEDGTVRDVKAGDCFTIARGFTGVWEVVETTEKSFVVIL